MGDKTPGTADEHDAMAAKPLHQPRPLNCLITLVDRSDAVLIEADRGIPNASALTPSRWITLPRYCESSQIQRKARCAELYTRRRIDCTGHIAGKPCVLSYCPRCRDRAADGFLENGLWRGR